MPSPAIHPSLQSIQLSRPSTNSFLPSISNGTLQRFLFACFIALSASSTVNATPAESELANLFPDSTAIYAEFAPASAWLDTDMRQRLLESESFLKLWRSPEVLKLRGGMTVAELALGDSVENVARKLTAGGWALAVDRQYEGAVLIAKSESAAWLDDYLDRVVKLVRGDENSSAKVEETKYRGAKAVKLDKTIFAAVNGYLLVSEKSELMRTMADRILDSGASRKDNLTSNPFFVEADQFRQAADVQGQPLAWLAIDLQVLRDANIAKELLGGRANDFGGEMILGGVLGVLHQARSLHGQLSLSEGDLRLSISTPYDLQWLGEQREHFVGPESKGVADAPLNIDGSIASLSAYRNLSQLWLWAGDLFDEGVNDQLAQADSTLTTLFSGHDFGTEILGAVYPELQLVVSHQSFDSAEQAPAIQLPSMALVARLRDPQLMRGELKRTFQSLVGLVNVTGAMDGQPQFDLDYRPIGDAPLYTAAYVDPIDARSDTPAPIQYNFSPAIAFVEDRVVLSSTIFQAEQLVQALQQDTAESVAPTKDNTIVKLSGVGVHTALLANRDQLIAQNILEKGHSRDEAENEIDALLSIVNLFESADLRLRFAEHVTLDMTVRVK